MESSIFKSKGFWVFFALVLGILSGYTQNEYVLEAAELGTGLFMNALKLISLPILFLSILSTITSLNDGKSFRFLGKSILKYTIGTTIIATLVALFTFLWMNPVISHDLIMVENLDVVIHPVETNYKQHILNIIPSNLVEAFNGGNVVGIVFVAFLFGFATLALEKKHKQKLDDMFSSLFQMIMQVARYVLHLIPIAVWGSITLLMQEFSKGELLAKIVPYMTTIMLANAIQGFIILPIFLKLKGISPLHLFKAMSSALMTAFLTKSSAATIPESIRCARDKAGIRPKVAAITIPLCGTINMNACAGFILITVLSVSMGFGYTFTAVELGLWVLLATVAAVGNAGVPMGCYFMASAYLASMNIPLHFMGVIVPFYLVLDMFETAINVWSDSCVTAVVDKEKGAEFEALVV